MDPAPGRQNVTVPAIPSLVELIEGSVPLSDDPYAPQSPGRFEPLDELISCILSQHTSDAISFPTFHRLRSSFTSWDQALESGQAKIEEVIRPAGLSFQKSRSIVGCLAAIKVAFGALTLDPLKSMETQEARDFLIRLPGVGQKTAAIVLSFALGRDVVPVDTHVFRVAWRLGLIDKKIGEARAHAALDAIVPLGFAFRFHRAFVGLGRKICKARAPLCRQCPVQRFCPSACFVTHVD